jgi:iron complex transport system ATP-binding protein
MRLLETQGLEIEVGGQRLCRGLDLRLEPGQCWALLGRNGAGKTSLLHTLAGLRPACGGEIVLEGQPLARLGRRQIARRLGLMFQDSADPFPASVLETALLGRHPHLGPWGREDAEQLELARRALAQVGLEALEQRQVASLSGGERRRLALASLLTQDPRLALLDEPVNHLDLPQQQLQLQLLRRRCAQGKAVLMVLHDINLALRFCTHLLLLYGDGRHDQGPSEQVAERERLERLYGHPLVELEGPRGRLLVPA